MKQQKRHHLITAMFLGLMLVTGSLIMGTTLEQLASLLPERWEGWQKNQKSQRYTQENLFTYVDGGAELYISYGFKQVLAQTYQKEGEADITVDIFDMGQASQAFGVFSHSREKIDHTIAADVESEYASGLLTFWKGPFYISILAYPETPEKKSLVLSIGKQIAAAITDASPLPALISLFPQENLDQNSIRYFRHYIWLNSHFFIADSNILNLNEQTEAVLGKYLGKGGDYYLLLVSYPDRTSARRAGQLFSQSYLPDADRGIKQLEDGRWTGYGVVESKLVIVFNAPQLEVLQQLLAAIIYPNK